MAVVASGPLPDFRILARGSRWREFPGSRNFERVIYSSLAAAEASVVSRESYSDRKPAESKVSCSHKNINGERQYIGTYTAVPGSVGEAHSHQRVISELKSRPENSSVVISRLQINSSRPNVI